MQQMNQNELNPLLIFFDMFNRHTTMLYDVYANYKGVFN